MDRIHGKVKDTESSLKRAQKSINYFMRALECDKCMLGLILLNVLALIALIVLLVKKGWKMVLLIYNFYLLIYDHSRI